jgi:hypothetical protein
MTASASFLTYIPASFTFLAAKLLVLFEVAGAQTVETLHR